MRQYGEFAGVELGMLEAWGGAGVAKRVGGMRAGEDLWGGSSPQVSGRGEGGTGSPMMSALGAELL